MEHRTSLLVGIVGASLVLFGAGCAGADKAVVSDDAKPPVSVPAEVDGKATGNIAFGNSLSVPANFPSKIPVYPNANITSVSANITDNLINLETKDSCTTAQSWYRTESEKRGWKTIGEDVGEAISSLSLVDAKDGATVTFYPEDGKCVVTFSTLAKSEMPIGNIDLNTTPLSTP